MPTLSFRVINIKGKKLIKNILPVPGKDIFSMYGRGGAMSHNKKTEKIIKELVLPLVESSGYELVDVEYKKEGKNWVLRLFIDHEKGIGLDDCKKVSILVSDELDRFDPIPHAYLLEVSSPGVERVLKNERDFIRFQGKKIYLKVFEPEDGKKEFVGKLLGLEDGLVALELPEKKLLVSLERVAKAHLIAEFSPD